MANDVIDKADSLMRRHRAFVAGDAPAVAVPPEPTFTPTTEHTPVPEDLPVLTEIVADDDEVARATTAAASDIEALLRERLAAALPQQRELLRRELALWLDEQLPQLVMRVLDGVTDQLVAQINTQARMTLLPKLQAALEADTDAPSAD
jgi:uncharacterized FlaG/YvyC family protein